MKLIQLDLKPAERYKKAGLLEIIQPFRERNGCMPGLWGFVGGVIAAAIGTKVVKSPATRKLAVQGLSKAMLIQQKAIEQLANIREEAQDLCHEAAAENRKPEQ